MVRLDRNVGRMTNRYDDLREEPNLQALYELRAKAKAQLQRIEERREELKREDDMLSELFWEYDALETEVDHLSREILGVLDDMGFPLNSTPEMIDRAYDEKDEFVTYAGKITADYYAGTAIVYRSEMWNDQNGNMKIFYGEEQ